MLIAVPASAMIGVLARFALSQYLHSRLYAGSPGQEGAMDRLASGGEGEEGMTGETRNG
jgi:hypothetical protein